MKNSTKSINQKTNMKLYPLTRFQKNAFLWFKVFFMICMICSISILFIHRPSQEKLHMTSYEVFTIFLPVVHYFFCWLIGLIFCILNSFRFLSAEDSQYIKTKYPKIHKKLHPMGNLSHNGFALKKFLLGKYDNGKNDRLNKIKFFSKIKIKLMFWPLFIVPIIWILSLTMIYIKIGYT